MTERLFVYGSLRRGSGHPMSTWLAAFTRVLAAGKVRGSLFRVSYYPGLVPGPGWVVGELLELELPTAKETLVALDAFEVCAWRDDDEFRRERSTIVLADGSEIEAWVYWFRESTQGLEAVPDGDWLASMPAGINGP